MKACIFAATGRSVLIGISDTRCTIDVLPSCRNKISPGTGQTGQHVGRERSAKRARTDPHDTGLVVMRFPNRSRSADAAFYGVQFFRCSYWIQVPAPIQSQFENKLLTGSAVCIVRAPAGYVPLLKNLLVPAEYESTMFEPESVFLMCCSLERVRIFNISILK